MKSRSSIILFAFLMLLCSCNGCKKKTNYSISADLMTAFNYKVGTYWIYRDSIGGSVDSFVVVNNQFTPAYPYENFTFDRVAISIADYKLGPIFGEDSSAWMMLLSINAIDLSVISTIDTTTGMEDFSPMVTYSFVPGPVTSVAIVNHADTGVIVQVLPTYVLNGQTYSEVGVVRHSMPGTSGKAAISRFYVNKDAGIIKMAVNYPAISLYRIWELQRYKIVK